MALTKEELLLRALDTTNMGSHIHEDLSDLITLITPKDVPLFKRLPKGKATALLHEWTETTLQGPAVVNGKYADGGLPAQNTHTHGRRGSRVMSVGRIAKATGLLRATNMVGQIDALAREMEEKLIDLMRVIEYFTYNGDYNAAVAAGTAPEMDGLATILTAGNGANIVDNNAAAAAAINLTEASLQAAITACYNTGGSPDLILAKPAVAYRIANFTADKIRYNGPGSGAGGVGSEGLKYLSPFGELLTVQPVRADFLTVDSVFVLDSSAIQYAYLSNGIEVEDLAHVDDSVSKLIKAYLTLEVRAISHHARINDVANA